jgi:cytoskeleton protein RodZ
MTEPPQATHAQAASAGALLRAARERAGVHIGFLAATLKVPVRKLELLEESRFDELPDATFVRALSLSVCRVLKCDAAPVLAALPRQEPVASTLEQVSHGMNTPFGRRGKPVVVMRTSSRGLGWVLTAVILVLAAAAWWAPADWQARLSGGSAGQGASTSVTLASPLSATMPAISSCSISSSSSTTSVPGASEILSP